MTGNGVMHNGTAVLDDYGHNLDRLKVTHYCCSWARYYADCLNWFIFLRSLVVRIFQWVAEGPGAR